MRPWNKKDILKWEYKKWKIEKWFEAEIMKNLRWEWYICFHPQDIGLAWKFLDCHFITPEWDLWWIEFKKIEVDSFNVKQFEDNQVILLRELEKRNPDIARVFIYSVKNNDYISLSFSTIWDNKNEKWWIKLWDKWNLLFNFG